MSLSAGNIENLRQRLTNNKTLSIPSKTKLNAFIINTKNAFDRTAYNAKMRNLRSRDTLDARRSGNLNSAMETASGSVSRGSVNPAKRSRMSPRGPLNGVSGISNASNNGKNVSSSPNKKKSRLDIPLMTAAMGAQRAIAAENNARRKAVANAKRKAIIDRQRVNANEREKAVSSKAAANNAKAKAATQAANNARVKAATQAANNARVKAATQAANNAKAKAVANKANANAKAKAVANKANANAKAKANANELNMFRKAKAAAQAANNAKAKAKAATPANSVRNSVTNIGNGGISLNNNANSSAFIAPGKREKIMDGKGKLEPQDDGKLMKRGILLEIIKMANRTSKMDKNSLLKLMPMVKNVNSIKEYHTYTWALLYDMISTLHNTKFTQLQITSKTLKDIHKKLMLKNTYTTGRTSNNGSMGNRREHEFNFTDEEVVEFLFLIWLDGNHDNYIHKSFTDWLDDKNSNSNYFTNKHRELAKKFVKEFPDPIKYMNNVQTFSGNKTKQRKEFITKALENVKGYKTICKICIETESVWFFIHTYNGDPGRVNKKNQTSVKIGFPTFTSGTPAKTSLAGNFETDLKMGIEKILNIKQSEFIFRGSREINKLKQNGIIHEVSLDQEGDEAILSRAISNTPSFRPYITTANLIDPGKYMLPSAAGSDDRSSLFNAIQQQDVTYLDRMKSHYHIGPVKFVIRNGGSDFFKVDLSIRKGGPPKTNSERMPTLDFFQLEINGKTIKQGEKKTDAINAPTKMGKFMGDALQYMTVAVQNTYRGKPRYFASGDGSACFMNAYFCHKLKIPLRLIIDTGVGRIRSTGLQNN